MVASGNAQLIHPEFTINADSIKYNQDTGDITGKNNVELQQSNQLILSNQFNYNTKTNIIQIDDLLLELTTPKNQQVYSKATQFIDESNVKKGKNGILTTCSYDPPHYFISADSFTIYPEKRIIGHNVRLVNPVLFFPLGFWSPAYVYDIGKRKIIYAMPLIGTNSIEGSFFKSQVDYVVNDNLTGEAYIDSMSQLGIGLGTKLNYNDFNEWNNSLYYYGISNTNYFAKAVEIEKKLSPSQTIKSTVESKNMYLIQGGSVSKDKNILHYKNKRINGSDTVVYTFNQSKLNSISPKDYHISYSTNSDNNTQATVSYKRSENSVESDQINLSNQWKIGHNIKNKNTFNFYQKTMSATDQRKDQYFKSNNQFSRSFKDFGTIETILDYTVDLDNDRVTDDIKNHIVQRLPEVNIRLNKLKLSDHWNLNQEIQYGNYHEQYFINSLNKQRQFSDSRFKLTQNFKGTYDYDFLNGHLSINTAYQQYYYTRGDQTFTLGNVTSYKTNSFSFLKTNTSHQRTWAPRDGNSPFYFDERDQIEKNELKETITLYYLSDQKYAFKYSTGYNWIVNYQLDNEFELKIRPNQVFRSIFRTKYMLRQHQYSPLVSRFDLTPNKRFSTSLQANYDLNNGEIINLNHILSGNTSATWEDRWIFKAYFTYAPKNNQNYQLETLSLTKDLHERKLTLMYNRLLEEYRFQFTINAFPDNKVGFTSNKYESFRLEGVFDDESIQR